jgi:hypothetical protein
VVIATSTHSEKLTDYVERLVLATVQPQIQFQFAPPLDLSPGDRTLPAGAQWLGKHSQFRSRLFLMDGGRFPGSARRDVGGLWLHAERRNHTAHV